MGIQQRYYIHNNHDKQGPFDLLALIKKIRNGALTQESLMSVEGQDQVIRALELQELVEYFDAAAEAAAESEAEKGPRDLALKKVLKNGVEFLSLHQTSTLFTGVFLLVTIGLIWLLSHIFIVGYVLAFVVSYILFTGYCLYILRLSRGQPVEFGYIFTRLKRNLVPLALSGAILSLIVGAGLALVAVPGLMLITLYMFAPLLIAERNMDFWPAMELSRKTVMKSGAQNFTVLFVLVVLNFVALVAFILPLLFVLPLTSGGISEIYDEYFQH